MNFSELTKMKCVTAAVFCALLSIVYSNGNYNVYFHTKFQYILDTEKNICQKLLLWLLKLKKKIIKFSDFDQSCY